MGVDPAEITVKAEIAEAEVLNPSIGKAKAAAPPMPRGVAAAEGASSGSGAAAKAAARSIPTPDAVARGTSGLAERLLTGSACSVITAAHGRAVDEKGVAEAVVAAERMVRRANESEIECVKAPTQIRDSQSAYPAMKDNPTYQGLIESFVSLSSDVTTARKAATDSKDGELGKSISQASTHAKADSVARWRSSAKCIAEMA